MSAVVSRPGIVVGVDGSPFWKAADWWADAVMCDGALTVVHVTARRHRSRQRRSRWRKRHDVQLVAMYAWCDVGAEAMPAVDWPALQTLEDKILAEHLAGWQRQPTLGKPA